MHSTLLFYYYYLYYFKRQIIPTNTMLRFVKSTQIQIQNKRNAVKNDLTEFICRLSNIKY